jgi:hypothetical protein
MKTISLTSSKRELPHLIVPGETVILSISLSLTAQIPDGNGKGAT